MGRAGRGCGGVGVRVGDCGWGWAQAGLVWGIDSGVMSSFGDVVTVQRTILAPAERIFAVVADPSRHHEFDGSGTVLRCGDRSGPVALGDEFSGEMKWYVKYRTINKVTEFEQDWRIAWSTRAPKPLSAWVAGRTWRFQLTPVAGGTRVAHSWDITTEGPVTRPMVRRMAGMARQNMAQSLDRLAAVVGSE